MNCEEQIKEIAWQVKQLEAQAVRNCERSLIEDEELIFAQGEAYAFAKTLGIIAKVTQSGGVS